VGSEASFRPRRATELVSESLSDVTEIIRVAAELQAYCEAQGWRFCYIGGLALQHWGEPRQTVDVDLTLLTGFGGEESFIAKLLSRYAGRIDDPAGFARTRRVLLLRSESGVGIDVALGGLPFEEDLVARSETARFPGGTLLRLCSAEDLIILKAFASRPRDWLDIEGIIVRRTGKLDWAYVLRQLAPLSELKDAPEILVELAKRRTEFER
jgi:hypothetical protein